MKIDFDSSIPLYRQLEKIILAEYVDKKEKGSKIPSIYKIADTYGVSVKVARKAFESLRNKNYIRSNSKTGTVIKMSQKGNSILNICAFDPGLTSEKFIFDRLVNDFSIDNPDIKVNFLRIPFEKYDNWLNELESRENPLDIIIVNESNCLDLRRHLVDLNQDSFLDNYDSLCFSEPKEMFTYGKRCYALPVYFSPVILLYNQNLFTPDFTEWTFDNFIAAITKASNPALKIFGFSYRNHPNRWPALMLAAGAKTFIYKGLYSRFDFDDNFFEKCRNILEMNDSGEILCIGGGSEDNNTLCHLLLEGRVASTTITYNELGMIAETIGEEIELSLCPLPISPTNSSLAVGTACGISKKSKNYINAKKFMQFLISERSQVFLKKSGCGVPARKNIFKYDTEKIGDLTIKGYLSFKDCLGNMEFFKMFQKKDSVVSTYDKTMRLLLTKSLSLQEAAQKIRDTDLNPEPKKKKTSYFTPFYPSKVLLGSYE